MYARIPLRSLNRILNWAINSIHHGKFFSSFIYHIFISSNGLLNEIVYLILRLILFSSSNHYPFKIIWHETIHLIHPGMYTYSFFFHFRCLYWGKLLKSCFWFMVDALFSFFYAWCLLSFQGKMLNRTLSLILLRTISKLIIWIAPFW